MTVEVTGAPEILFSSLVHVFPSYQLNSCQEITKFHPKIVFW